ncbi:MAG: M23 family metallopeptidase [Gammaproteobacteria bacterium]|jgi:murein DD-endopeptidase MepM/ murein hydrolase activator NlpD
MDIIVVSSQRGRTWRLSLALRRVDVWLPLVAGVSLLLAVAFTLGYWLRGDGSVLPSALVTAWAKEVHDQRAALSAARASAQENSQALARRIAQLQAHMLRLEAAGSRLTKIAGLDHGEFNFSQPPAMGGPEVAAEEEGMVPDVMASLTHFERQLSDRERQLRVLEDLLLASRLQGQIKPSGWPVESGWISSLFGWRTDPFTGRRSLHEGVDFAGREGSDVLAVASGIVTEASSRFGYGYLVEINHGNGYVTRYGHNRSLLVQIGEKVNKGQRIALLGSTGRSTGPHVHFEVLFNGRTVNPEQYIQAAR